MTREEIRRHARAILALRQTNHQKAALRMYARGYDTAADFDPNNRRVYRNAQGRRDGPTISPVDDAFRQHERTGRISRECWR